MALNFPIKLVKWETTKDVYGNNKETVIKNVSTFANIESDGGSKSFNDGYTAELKSCTFRIRFNPNFNPTGNWRIVYDGRSYDVQSVEKEDERNFFWKFKATSK